MCRCRICSPLSTLSSSSFSHFDYFLSLLLLFLLLLISVAPIPASTKCSPPHNGFANGDGISATCSENVSLYELRLPFQYIKFAPDDVPLAHLVTTVPLEYPHHLVHLNASGDWRCARTLDGLLLDRPPIVLNNGGGQCSAQCLLKLTAMAKWTGTEGGSSDEFRRFPSESDGSKGGRGNPYCSSTASAGFSPLPGIPPIFCAKGRGFCGATIPLYSFYSASKKDQILTTAKEDRQEEEEAFSLEYKAEFGRNPICYIWPFPHVEIILPNNLAANDHRQSRENQPKVGCELIGFSQRIGQSLFGETPEMTTSTTMTSSNPTEEKEEEEDGEETLGEDEEEDENGVSEELSSGIAESSSRSVTTASTQDEFGTSAEAPSSAADGKSSNQQDWWSDISAGREEEEKEGEGVKTTAFRGVGRGKKTKSTPKSATTTTTMSMARKTNKQPLLKMTTKAGKPVVELVRIVGKVQLELIDHGGSKAAFFKTSPTSPSWAKIDGTSRSTRKGTTRRPTSMVTTTKKWSSSSTRTRRTTTTKVPIMPASSSPFSQAPTPCPSDDTVFLVSSDTEGSGGSDGGLLANLFLPSNWRWWILFGALSALILCCAIISLQLCHMLCIQSATFAFGGGGHGPRVVSSYPSAGGVLAQRKRSLPGTGQTY